MKSRVPRKVKKVIKKSILIYDLAGLPIDISFKDIYERYLRHGVVVWCSAASGNTGAIHVPQAPRLIPHSNKIRLVDKSLQKL